MTGTKISASPTEGENKGNLQGKADLRPDEIATAAFLESLTSLSLPPEFSELQSGLVFFQGLLRKSQEDPSYQLTPQEKKSLALFFQKNARTVQRIAEETQPWLEEDQGTAVSEKKLLVGEEELRGEKEVVGTEGLPKLRIEERLLPFSDLFAKMQNNELVLRGEALSRPKADDEQAWSIRQKSRWIETLLLRLPLPLILLEIQHDDRWVVYDGEQRLLASKAFASEPSFPLENLAFLIQYEGKRFHDLPRHFQRRLLEGRWPVYTIEKGTSEEIKRSLFLRYQTKSPRLSLLERLEFLKRGPINAFLDELETKLETHDLRSFLPPFKERRQAALYAALEYLGTRPLEADLKPKDETILFERFESINRMTAKERSQMQEEILAKLRQKKHQEQNRNALLTGLTALAVGGTTAGLIAFALAQLSKKNTE